MVGRNSQKRDKYQGWGTGKHMPKDREKALQALLCFCMRYPDGNQQGLLGMFNETAWAIGSWVNNETTRATTSDLIYTAQSL